MATATLPTVETRAPGLYPGTSYEEYARIEGARASILRHFERSAAHAREEILNPTTSKARDFGNAYHCAVLEPARFAVEFVRGLDNNDKRFKAEKERYADFCAQHRGRTVLLPTEWDAIVAMQVAVYAHETAAALLHAPGLNEVVAVWDDASTGVRCKGRIDRLCSWLGWTWVPDLKTTTNASPQGWPKEIGDYGYMEPAAFYLDGLDAVDVAAGSDPRQRRFLWISQEKVAPFAVAVHEPDDEAITEGRRRYRRHLRAYAEAMRTNAWPAYPVGVLPTSLKKWDITKNEETEETEA